MTSSEGYNGPQWQLYRFDKLYPYRYHKNIPTWAKEHICLCQHFTFSTGKGYPTCGVCGKLPIYLLLTCKMCGEVYLKCFRHPDVCPACPVCWNCIQTSGPCTIDFHQRPVPWHNDTKPPKFKPPRRFTAEELADFDPFA